MEKFVGFDDKSKNIEDSINPHVDKLEAGGFFLETFYFFSAIIEFELQTTIKYQEDWIRGLVKKSNFAFEGCSEKKLSEQPLGVLIKIFSSYCEDAKLVSKLNNFNSFRKKITHNLLSQPVEYWNNEAKRRRKEFYLLVIDLIKYSVFVINKHSERQKRLKKKT